MLAGGALPCCGAEPPTVDAVEVALPVTSVSGAAVGAALPPSARSSGPRATQGSIAWVYDLDAAWALALRERRSLFVYVRAGWSVPALDMERGALVAPEVERAARPYVAVYVDLTSDEVLARAQAKLGASLDRIPTVELVDPRTRTRRVLYGAIDADELAEELGSFVTP
ncbi:MAG: hypothetical protein IPM79_20625 [Polyangiaceae bacterium]|nr:hypothetical protein [Polyangiaceae bacterium]MBK8939959.1 hypothetical protein [Polyangiaceae bacterium]